VPTPACAYFFPYFPTLSLASAIFHNADSRTHVANTTGTLRVPPLAPPRRGGVESFSAVGAPRAVQAPLYFKLPLALLLFKTLPPARARQYHWRAVRFYTRAFIYALASSYIFNLSDKTSAHDVVVTPLRGPGAMRTRSSRPRCLLRGI
jgi:hypothetical protein